jgi:uncharacterized protein (TIGR00369 family)
MHGVEQSLREKKQIPSAVLQFAVSSYAVGMDLSTEKLIPMTRAAQNRCFGCGPASPAGLHLEFLLAEDGSAVCLPTVPDLFEGPPGFLHGGIIATLLDEAMSKSVRARGLTAMTRQMEIVYLRPVHSATPLRLEGRLLRSDGRKHWTEARILNSRGHVLAEAKGLFIEVHRGHGF